MPRILSVSYDSQLLETRRLMLERAGYDVVSAFGFNEAIHQCRQDCEFDLFVLGHSIQGRDKEALIEAFRQRQSSPILALKAYDGEFVKGATASVNIDPEQVMKAVSSLLSGKTRNDQGAV